MKVIDDTGLVREARGTANRGVENRGVAPSPPSAKPATAPAVAPQSKPTAAPAQAPAAGWFDDYASRYTGQVITDEDWSAAAKELGCEVRAIKAVAEVESGPLGAFWKAGWPTILYERHLFSKATGRKFDKTNPDISGKGYRFANKEEKKGALISEVYAWTQDGNYARMEKAYALDPAAALASASWGKFQILGQNHGAAGFSNSVQDYVRSACASEKEQLSAFVQFVKNDARLLKAVKAKDWAGFAGVYNGKDYKKFNYDTRMKAAYDKQQPSGTQ